MTPEEEYISFHFEIGQAITQWANVEFALYWVVTLCFNDKDPRAPAITFFSIDNFRAKLQLADSLMCMKFRREEISEWDDIHRRLMTLSKARNKLAHQRVVAFLRAPPGRRYALLPRLSYRGVIQGTAGNRPPSHALCVREIVQQRLRFQSLAATIENFVCRMLKRTEVHAKSAEQDRAPPTIHQLARRLHKVLGHEPSSSCKRT